MFCHGVKSDQGLTSTGNTCDEANAFLSFCLCIGNDIVDFLLTSINITLSRFRICNLTDVVSRVRLYRCRNNRRRRMIRCIEPFLEVNALIISVQSDELRDFRYDRLNIFALQVYLFIRICCK